MPPRPTRTTAPSPMHGSTNKRIPKALSRSTTHKRKWSHEAPRHRDTPTGMENRHNSFSIKRSAPRSVIRDFGSTSSKGYDPKKPDKEN